MATYVGGEALLLVSTHIARRIQNVIEYLLGDIAISKIVTARNGGTRRIAAHGRVHGLVEAIEIDDLAGTVITRVTAPIDRHRPVPVRADTTFHAEHCAEGVHILVELAVAPFFQAAPLQQDVLSGWVGRVIGRNVDRTVDPERTGSGQLIRLAVGIHQLGEAPDIIGERVVAKCAEAYALDGVDSIEVRICVLVVLFRRVGLVKVTITIGILVEVDSSAIGQQCATTDGARAAHALELPVDFAQATGGPICHIDGATF